MMRQDLDVFEEMLGMNLPKSWSLVPLEKISASEKGAIRRGPFGGSLKKSIFVESGFKVYEQQNAIKNDFQIGHYFIDEKKYREMEGFSVKPNDIIISCAGTIGRIAIVPEDAEPGVINQALMRIRPNTNIVLCRYLKYLLESPKYQRDIFGKSAGSALKNLAAISEIKECKIPLPPLEEQRRIAAILDKADAIRRKRKQAIQYTEELLRATFLDMFGDPVTNPKGWKKEKLGDISKVQGGLQVTSKRRSLPVEVPYLRVANVYRDKLVLDEIKTIQVTQEELKRAALDTGDLLIVEGHGNNQEIGRSSVWNGSIVNCTHQNHLIRVRLDKAKAEPCFVSAFLNSEGGRKQLTKFGKTTSGLNTISTSNVKAAEVFLPPILLQQKYLKVRQEILGCSQTYEHQHQESDNLFNSLLQRAFRGEM